MSKPLAPDLVEYGQQLLDNGWHVEDIAAELKCSSMTVRNRLDWSNRKPYKRTGKRVLHNHILTTRW